MARHYHYLRGLLVPGGISPRVVLMGSVIVMVVVMVFDLITPADIRLHSLYVFPLAAIALHCDRIITSLEGLALSVTFQFANFFFHGIANGPLATDAIVAFASSSLTVFLARAAREHYLATVTLATTDWLTGLHNRRSFESIADGELSRHKRYGGVFSLAVIDLDNFKALNDSAGHYVGDQALKLLADVLRKHTRQSDFIARLGGDEFALLLPNTQDADCKTLCQQLSAAISNRMAAATFPITASIGYATFERTPNSTSDALHAADKAMYSVKADSKGCA